MEPELIPHAPDGEGRAVLVALDRAGIDLEPRDDAYHSVWRAAGVREGVDRGPADAPGLGPEPSLL